MVGNDGNPDVGMVYVAAVRYGLGRATYAPSLIIEATLDHADKLTPNDKHVIARDIRREVQANPEMPHAYEWSGLALALAPETEPWTNPKT